MKLALISTAKINQPCVLEPVKLLQNSSVEIVFSRDLIKAERYANKHRIHHFATHSNVEKFLDCFDTAYISVPNALHFDFASKLLEMGKNVICEKPLCFTLNETIKLESLAKNKNKIVSEAYHFRYHPLSQEHIHKIRNQINIGDSSLTIFIGNVPPPSNDIRLSNTLGGGAFAHLGCYIADFVTSLTPKTSVETIEINKLRRRGKVDTYVEGNFTLANNLKVQFTCSLEHSHLESYVILKNNHGESIYPHVFTPSSDSTYISTSSLSSYFFQLKYLENKISRKSIDKLNAEGTLLFERLHQEISCTM